ncbi:MAG: endolytic transglycosylase MltG [Bacteroidota bacterium]
MRRTFKIALTIAMAIVVCLFVALWLVFYQSNDFAGAGEKYFTVSRGQTFALAVDSLEAQGLIENREVFIFVARILGGANRIQVGRYVFPNGISNTDLFLSLREGKRTTPITVTLPEGLRSSTQARILGRLLGIDSTRYVNLVHDEEFVRSLGFNARSLEGYLLPETYRFAWQTPEDEVIKQLVGEFRRFYDDSLQARARDLGWTTNQVLTMASIVEGEAVLDEERTRISGVYHNRLRTGMKLQADPTIQFLIDGGPRRVLYSDLRMDNPYNTYRYRGLPPGPVNNPGKASIKASLFPEQHKYLFFVANGLGGHWFTTNYSEHMRFVRKYRKLREARLDPLTQAGKNKGLNKN